MNPCWCQHPSLLFSPLIGVTMSTLPRQLSRPKVSRAAIMFSTSVAALGSPSASRRRPGKFGFLRPITWLPPGLASARTAMYMRNLPCLTSSEGKCNTNTNQSLDLSLTPKIHPKTYKYKVLVSSPRCSTHRLNNIAFSPAASTPPTSTSTSSSTSTKTTGLNINTQISIKTCPHLQILPSRNHSPLWG